MIIHIREFKALWDAWEYCDKMKDNDLLLSKPLIIEKKRKGKLISVTVIVKLKKKD